MLPRHQQSLGPQPGKQSLPIAFVPPYLMDESAGCIIRYSRYTLTPLDNHNKLRLTTTCTLS